MKAKPGRKHYIVSVKLRKGALDQPNFGELDVLTRSLGVLWSAMERLEIGNCSEPAATSATQSTNERDRS